MILNVCIFVVVLTVCVIFMKFHLFVRKIILKENGEKKSILRTMLVLILKYASPANYSSPKNMMLGEFTIPCNIMY